MFSVARGSATIPGKGMGVKYNTEIDLTGSDELWDGFAEGHHHTQREVWMMFVEVFDERYEQHTTCAIGHHNRTLAL